MKRSRWPAFDTSKSSGAAKRPRAWGPGWSPRWVERVLAAKTLSGWLNVPADCLRPLPAVHLHAARPAGRNEPTAEGIAGSEEMLRRVAALGPSDLCFCLISGGGSALMPAPVAGVSLADKLAVTQLLSTRGASIEELNTVRTPLSRIKGGGLARACKAGRLIALVLSDVLGDPLEIIASGPTVPCDVDPRRAENILARYAGLSAIPASIRAARSRSVRSGKFRQPAGSRTW